MTVYLEVTKDKYELPVAVADTVRELAEIRGTTKNSIDSAISHCKKKGKWCKYIRVEVDE